MNICSVNLDRETTFLILLGVRFIARIEAQGSARRLCRLGPRLGSKPGSAWLKTRLIQPGGLLGSVIGVRDAARVRFASAWLVARDSAQLEAGFEARLGLTQNPPRLGVGLGSAQFSGLGSSRLEERPRLDSSLFGSGLGTQLGSARLSSASRAKSHLPPSTSPSQPPSSR